MDGHLKSLQLTSRNMKNSYKTFLSEYGTEVKQRRIMKGILLLILFVTVCTVNIQAQIQADWEKEELKGRVKTVEEFEREAVEKSGGVEIKESSWYPRKELKEYDREGRLIESNWRAYDDRGKNIYKYDDKGNRIEKNSDGRTVKKWIYKYDEKGNTIENEYHSNGSLVEKNIYKYDEEGNKIENNRYYYVNGNLGDKEIYKYDEKGKCIGNHSYGADGRISKSTYKYDEQGNIIEISTYSMDDRLIGKSTHEYKYDHEGNWIRHITYEECNGKKYLIQPAIERKIEYYE